MYTWIYNKALKSKSHDQGSWMEKKLNSIVRAVYDILYKKQLGRDKQIVIKTQIDGKSIWVPFTHRLAFFKVQFPGYDLHLKKICKYVCEKQGRICLVDIGANVGDTVLNVGITDNSNYLCIEGNPIFYHLIDKNLFKKYTYTALNCYVSERDNPSENSYTLDTIVSNNNFVPNFIKVDTDGHDFQIIRGSMETIKKFNPVIFFEWEPPFLIKQNEEPLSIFRELKKLGYLECLVFDNFGELLQRVSFDDIENLELLKQYTLISNKRIYHYDIVTFYKESVMNIHELIRFIENKRNML